MHIVAIAPDGQIASLCTVWHDNVTRTVLYEPGGTMPAHQRRGPAKAITCEGVRRLKGMGVLVAFVNGHDAAVNAPYDAATN